jgi:hypothetical protein
MSDDTRAEVYKDSSFYSSTTSSNMFLFSLVDTGRPAAAAASGFYITGS